MRLHLPLPTAGQRRCWPHRPLAEARTHRVDSTESFLPVLGREPLAGSWAFGVAGTGVAGTGVAGTGVAGTGVAGPSANNRAEVELELLSWRVLFGQET